VSKNIGRLGTLKVETATNTFTAMGGVTTISRDDKSATIDSTDFDSLGMKESEYGDRQIVISGTVNLEESDAAQAAFQTAYEGHTKIRCQYLPTVGTGFQLYQATFKINKWTITNAQGAMVTAQFEIESSGAVSKSTQ
jgi:predicted secreted protein